MGLKRDGEREIEKRQSQWVKSKQGSFCYIQCTACVQYVEAATSKEEKENGNKA